MPHLQIKPEVALAQQKINGMVLLCYEFERPLQGVMGELDWCLNGVFSKLLKTQIITGKKGESVYVPVSWNGNTFHFLVIGAGSDPQQKQSFKVVENKLNELKLSGLGISASDWDRHWKDQKEDPNLWILN